MKKILEESFFAQKTPIVARELVGKLFVVMDPASKKKWVTRIVETEAYRATDPASHCARGWTVRSAPMFEKPGHAYVYFIYGVHEMLNFTTEPEGKPGAVLIRALEWISGPSASESHPLVLNGPGKLTRALGIARKDNRKSLNGKRFQVWDDGVTPPAILITPRVGIREESPYQPWRFFWEGHPVVSRAKENKNILKRIVRK